MIHKGILKNVLNSIKYYSTL